MPNDYISFMTHDNPPDVKQAPVVNNGFITFGSYNNIQKLNPTIVKAWTEILNKVENSKLIIKTHKAADQSVVKYFSDMFIDNGADISRISFVGESVEHFDALDYYNNFDISLDTTPYSSGVTCLECLFMGTPMVAITGNTFAGRHSTTHLMNAGLPELVASNLEEYIEKAVNLANNVDRIKEYKASLRNDLMKSPVMNHVQFANDLENEIRKMWVKYCAEN
jgi:predicted O-linked N-acetylglucosamine transferase (SPINDLY family)